MDGWRLGLGLLGVRDGRKWPERGPHREEGIMKHGEVRIVTPWDEKWVPSNPGCGLSCWASGGKEAELRKNLPGITKLQRLGKFTLCIH